MGMLMMADDVAVPIYGHADDMPIYGHADDG